MQHISKFVETYTEGHQKLMVHEVFFVRVSNLLEKNILVWLW